MRKVLCGVLLLAALVCFAPAAMADVALYTRHDSDAWLVDGKSDYSHAEFSRVYLELPLVDGTEGKEPQSRNLTITGGTYSYPSRGGLVTVDNNSKTFGLMWDENEKIYSLLNEDGEKCSSFSGKADTGLNGVTVSWTGDPASSDKVPDFTSTKEQLAKSVPYIELDRDSENKITGFTVRMVKSSDTTTAVTSNEIERFRVRFATAGEMVKGCDWKNYSYGGETKSGTPENSISYDALNYVQVDIRLNDKTNYRWRFSPATKLHLESQHVSQVCLIDNVPDYSTTRFNCIEMVFRGDVSAKKYHTEAKGTLTINGNVSYVTPEGEKSGTGASFGLEPRMSEGERVAYFVPDVEFRDVPGEVSWTFNGAANLKDGKDTLPQFISTEDRLATIVPCVTLKRSGDRITGFTASMVNSSDIKTPVQGADKIQIEFITQSGGVPSTEWMPYEGKELSGDLDVAADNLREIAMNIVGGEANYRWRFLPTHVTNEGLTFTPPTGKSITEGSDKDTITLSLSEDIAVVIKDNYDFRGFIDNESWAGVVYDGPGDDPWPHIFAGQPGTAVVRALYVHVDEKTGETLFVNKPLEITVTDGSEPGPDTPIVDEQSDEGLDVSKIPSSMQVGDAFDLMTVMKESYDIDIVEPSNVWILNAVGTHVEGVHQEFLFAGSPSPEELVAWGNKGSFTIRYRKEGVENKTYWASFDVVVTSENEGSGAVLIGREGEVAKDGSDSAMGFVLEESDGLLASASAVKMRTHDLWPPAKMKPALAPIGIVGNETTVEQIKPNLLNRGVTVKLQDTMDTFKIRVDQLTGSSARAEKIWKLNTSGGLENVSIDRDCATLGIGKYYILIKADETQHGTMPGYYVAVTIEGKGSVAVDRAAMTLTAPASATVGSTAVFDFTVTDTDGTDLVLDKTHTLTATATVGGVNLATTVKMPQAGKGTVTVTPTTSGTLTVTLTSSVSSKATAAASVTVAPSSNTIDDEKAAEVVKELNSEASSAMNDALNSTNAETKQAAQDVAVMLHDSLTEEQMADLTAEEIKSAVTNKKNEEAAKETEKKSGEVADAKVPAGTDLLESSSNTKLKDASEKLSAQPKVVEPEVNVASADEIGTTLGVTVQTDITIASADTELTKQTAAVEDLFNKVSADLANVSNDTTGKGVVIAVVFPKMRPNATGFFPLMVNLRHLTPGRRLRFWPSVSYFRNFASGKAAMAGVSLVADGKEGDSFFLDEAGNSVSTVRGDASKMTAVPYLTAGKDYGDAFITADATSDDQKPLEDLAEAASSGGNGNTDPNAPTSDKDGGGCDMGLGGMALLLAAALLTKKR